jgi:hypothetical protein
VTRKSDVAERVEDLKIDLPRYAAVFELERPFGDPISHLKTLRLLRKAGSTRAALDDADYLQSLWKTLHDWR